MAKYPRSWASTHLMIHQLVKPVLLLSNYCVIYVIPVLLLRRWAVVCWASGGNHNWFWTLKRILALEQDFRLQHLWSWVGNRSQPPLFISYCVVCGSYLLSSLQFGFKLEPVPIALEWLTIKRCRNLETLRRSCVLDEFNKFLLQSNRELGDKTNKFCFNDLIFVLQSSLQPTVTSSPVKKPKPQVVSCKYFIHACTRQ